MGRYFSVIAALGLAAASVPALGQGWKEYSYPQSGFTVQFPAEPAVSQGSFHAGAGPSVPSTTYSVRQDGIDYSVMVADYSGQRIDGQTAMAEAIKALGDVGEIKVDTSERIDRDFGHDITLARKDGSRSMMAIFFVGNRLYELDGKALAPNAEAGSGKTARFQQTLVFIDAQGRQPTRPEDGAGPGGRGGPGGWGGPPGGPGGPGRGPPPASAFEDCKGKAEGAAVQHKTPQGSVAATCVSGPQGLFARPNMPPPFGPPPQ